MRGQSCEGFSLNVERYMFCHPQNIEYPYKQKPIMHWQHLMMISDLLITITMVDSKVDHIIVTQGCRVLERVNVTHQLDWKNPIRVVKMHDWISVKWSTRNVATQFQVKLLSLRDCERIVRCLEERGVSITRESSREEQTVANPESGDETLCDPCTTESQYNQSLTQYSQTQSQTQYSQTQYSQNQSDRVCFNLDPVLQSLTPVNQAQYNQVQSSQTQLNTQLSLKLFRQTNQYQPGKLLSSADQSGVRLDTVDPRLVSDATMEDSSDILSLAEKVSVFSETSSHKSIKKRQGLRSLNIPGLIKNKTPMNLKVDSYSFMASRRLTTKGIWRHVALTSDLCLSLVPSDFNNYPIVLFSRGTQVLEHFVPHPGYLKAFYTRGIITFQQFSPDRKYERLVEIHMKDVNVDATCEWLRAWMVNVEDVMHPNMGADLSTGGPSSMMPDSDSSNISRESRWWTRRSVKFKRRA